MKRILNLLMMAFVLMMTGCSVSNTPEDVAVRFMEALHSCDFKEAMNYCSEGSKGAMEKQVAFFEEMKKKGPLEITEPQVSLVSCKISEDGESAVVRVEVKNSSVAMKRKGEALEVRVDMVKEDGKWVAVFRGK